MNDQPTPVAAQLQAPSQTPSIISLIVGILALLSGIITIVSVPLGIVAIILGVIGIRKKAGKGLAIGGIVTGSIGLVTGLLIAPLLVFIALPSLQKNQADIQVKSDVAAAVAGAHAYRAENNGALPSVSVFDSSTFRTEYLPDANQTELTYAPGVSCDGSAGTQLFNVSAKLASGDTYCLDS